MSLRRTANSYLRRLTGYEVRKFRPPAPKPAAKPKPPPAKPKPPQPPTLHDFTKLSVLLEVAPTDLLVALGWPVDDVAKVVDEFDQLTDELKQRYTERETLFPERWGVERGTGLTLYGLARLLKPKTVVETGIADGRSSFMILSALDRNEQGTLYSFDVRPDAGSLVKGHPRWRQTVSDAKDPRRSFTEVVDGLDTIDLFLHDSDHGYPNQMFEYESAWPKIPSGGVLASDDVDLTKAYVDFATKIGARPHFLFDRRKILGAIRREAA
ncbi:putative O-methyltransferase YrrM [Krasilnikovia cinnamomea]|uniref:Putative O-methyltransferase YrrM n=1 Tax=Krasilnikovia cinnamomea TaxID=349313 RepID=A0A4Q7ZII0_9ACTN|nr:class I SAM-dependent methyltransferase [Krasilnikovia cinnamomea]RZU50274.1 putative O-methyltransferase YrrM [Krasilnikovia cinnamomea]